MKKVLFFLGVVLLLAAGCSYSPSTEEPNIFANNISATETQSKQKPKTSINETSLSDTLNLSGQNLSVFPDNILKNNNIEKLDLSNNKLSGAIPAEIKNLNNLKVLDLSNNLMTGVPAEIGQLTNLEELNLANNQLTGLPFEKVLAGDTIIRDDTNRTGGKIVDCSTKEVIAAAIYEAITEYVNK